MTAPGFFGKLPARGDFLSRRVPPGVAAAWEAWLQALTVAGRAAGDETWLTAPLWHFALGRAVAPPHGAAGVLVASADRVGRLFPFTIIGAGDPAGAAGLQDWTGATEALAIQALEDEFDPATLDEALAALGPPPAITGPDGAPGAWPPEDESGPGAGQSAWWCRGSDHIAPVRLLCTGLPGPRTCAAMIAGGEEVMPGA